ncbi:MAG: diaminopimelate dehydrogenase [Clostridia bacterium]|nr:diaminopimelate dehydrogenase [Clostridia bacterium]
MKIKIGIIGYGNLGKGVELALRKNPDMELVGVFSRRNPEGMKSIFPETKFYSIKDAQNFKDSIDVMLLCGGSATDLPVQGPEFLKGFNTVDSFDTHAKIPAYFGEMDKIAKENSTCGVISVGWDPGVFSISRMMFGAFLPDGVDYTFWGKGVSQGHSDAIRRIEGVADARQYTVPVEKALELVEDGQEPELSTREMHTRDCYVVAEDGADLDKIENTIKTMPNYFADYDTTVTFITQEELDKDHSGIPHGGFVIRSGQTCDESKHILELSLKLDSNPEFTASVLVAYARAAAKLADEGKFGAYSVFDIPLSYLSPKTPDELRAELL